MTENIKKKKEVHNPKQKLNNSNSQCKLTNLKLFQARISSRKELLPHSAKIHRVLYYFMVVWQLYDKQEKFSAHKKC